MARRNSPDRAYKRFLEPLEKALRCDTPERLSVIRTSRLLPGPDYALVFNDKEPVMLRGVTAIALSAGQRLKIIEDSDLDSGPFQIRVVEYWYETATPEGSAILTVHTASV